MENNASEKKVADETYCDRVKRRICKTKTFDNETRLKTKLDRCLTTFDLVSYGIAAMVGSSIFILTGTVVRNRAGPLTFVSYIIAGVVALPNSLIYAELACLIPKAGSTYVYAYVILYELIAFITGWSILLEYVISSAAVARACTTFLDIMSGEKISNAFIHAFGKLNANNYILANYLDPLASLFLIVIALISCFGIKSSATFNNIMVVLNLIVILVVTIYLYIYASIDNLYSKPPANYTLSDKLSPITYSPLNPVLLPFGLKGLISGAATCFNSFIGFDVISTCAEETKNPGKSLPKANIIAVFIVTILLSLCSLSLTLYIPWYLVDPEVAFSMALIHSKEGKKDGNLFMFYFVSIGALIGNVACLLGNLIAATRILYSMAEDNLVFGIFKYVWKDMQTPVYSTLMVTMVGAVLTLIFSIESLADFLSLGTLIAYSVASFVIIKYRFTRPFKMSDEKKSFDNIKESEVPFEYLQDYWAEKLPNWIKRHLVNKRNHGKMPMLLLSVYTSVLICLLFTINVTSVFFDDNQYDIPRYICIIIISLVMIALVFLIGMHKQKEKPDPDMFWLPCVPVVPCIAILFNAILISQLTWLSWIRFIMWLGIGLTMYFSYGILQDEDPTENEEGSEVDEEVPVGKEDEKKDVKVTDT